MKRTFLYHPEKGQKLFEIESPEQEAELIESGWLDSPAKFPSAEQENPAPRLNDVEKTLLEVFKANPKELTKPEHLELGKALGLTLMAAWKEDTLINKIQEALDGNGTETN